MRLFKQMIDGERGMNIYKRVGERIREVRKSFGLTQAEFAKRLSVAPNTVSRWETSAYHPSLEDLEIISREFGIDYTMLLPLKGECKHPRKLCVDCGRIV